MQSVQGIAEIEDTYLTSFRNTATCSLHDKTESSDIKGNGMENTGVIGRC